MRRSKRCLSGISKQKRTDDSTKKKKNESQSGVFKETQSDDQALSRITNTTIANIQSTSPQITSSQIDTSGGRTAEVFSEHNTLGKNMPDFFFQDEDGDTYLHIAVAQCNEGLVNFLIQAMKTRQLDIFNNLRQTPLHLAVITGQINLIGPLIKAGCDINAMDRHGQTPLHLACQRSNVDSARAIFDSASMSRKDIKLESKNFDGLSALHVAAMTGNRDLIGLLIDKGADIDTKDTRSGRTPLHHVVEAGKSHVVEFCLSRGASANATTYSGNTPLHTAAGRHMQEMVRLLSLHGADVNIANYEGEKPKVVLQGSEQGKRQLEASRKRTKTPSSSKTNKGSGSSTKKSKS